jgi:large subunit ribosomal protein L10
LEVIRTVANPDKEAKVADLKERMGGVQALVLADYRGLTVQEINELRRAMRRESIDFAVVKNTLFNLALEGTGAEGIRPLLTGPTAVAFSRADTVTTAKTLVEFAKTHEKLKIKGGFADGQLYTADQIRRLSEIPPRDVLLATIVGALQAPMRDLAFTLRGVLSNFVFTLQAVADKRAAAGA